MCVYHHFCYFVPEIEKYFNKGSDKQFGLNRKYCLCKNHPTLTTATDKINEWIWLHCNKTLFTKLGCWMWPAGHNLLTHALY